MDLIWHNSYGTTSVDAICDRAGAKKGSFYYFLSRNRSSPPPPWKRTGTRRRRKWIRFFSPTIPPLGRLDRYFDFVQRSPRGTSEECGSILGCPLLSIGSEVSTSGPQMFVKRSTGSLDRKMSYFISAVRDAQAQGLY